MKHEKKQAPRFAKWLAKAAAAYLFFFLTGLLMGLVPAGSLGLSGPAFFSLRMCWMLLGPVYATLAARLILAFLAAAQKPGPGAAEKAQSLCWPSRPCCCWRTFRAQIPCRTLPEAACRPGACTTLPKAAGATRKRAAAFWPCF